VSAFYFNHEFLSNSDLKRLKKYWDPNAAPEPENLEEIFDLGTLIHACLLEPKIAEMIVNKKLTDAIARNASIDEINKINEDYELAKAMAATIRKHPIIGPLMLFRDFKVEHEFYRYNIHGVDARCICDGASRALDFVFEYKGLSVTTENAFRDAIVNFDYDQGAAWYLDTAKRKRMIIAGVSKKDPRKIFKVLIDRDHIYYKTGLEKVLMALEIKKQLIG
jgi:hypothetical protein